MVPIPATQMGFIRDIQEAFGRGVDPDVLAAILGRFTLISTTLISLFLVWRYWDKVVFFSRRAWAMKKHAPVRSRIMQHLQERRVFLELYVLKSKTQQFVGRATLEKSGTKRMRIGFVSEVPNALSRVITGKRVICYCKPFKVGGNSVNSFQTYIIKTMPGVTGIKTAVMHTPASFVNTVRRSSPRKRVSQADAVRLRLWGAAKKDKFMVLAPDYETPTAMEGASAWKKATKVVNLSSGGLKLEIHPRRNQHQPRVNEQVVLEVMVLNPKKKSFTPFTFMAAVRSVARPPSGAVYLGIQFMAQGERTGSRAVNWMPLKDGVGEIEAILGG